MPFSVTLLVTVKSNPSVPMIDVWDVCRVNDLHAASAVRPQGVFDPESKYTSSDAVGTPTPPGPPE